MKKIVICLSSLLVLSCGSIPKTSTNKNDVTTSKEANSNSSILMGMNKKDTFETLKINSTITVENGSFVPPLEAIFYIENGQRTWVNLSAMFFNVARAEIKTNSVQAYEKYNKTYIDSDFGYLQNLFGIDFIDYQSFQNLILGKTILPLTPENSQISKNENGYTVSLRKETKNNDVFSVLFSYSQSFELQNIHITKENSADQVDIFYNNWISIDSSYFPESVKIIIKNKKTTQIQIQNTKFEFTQMSTPYSVPQNYTKKDIK